MPSLRLIPMLAASLWLCACSTYRESVAIHFSSDPPGANVVVDGVPTGYSTPCIVALPKRRQVITIEMEGYQVPTRVLFPAPFNDTWFLSEANVGPHTFRFPIFINLDDFLQPVRAKNALLPARIFVRLKRLSDAPRRLPQ